MKNWLIIFCIISSGELFSQNVGIGTNNPLSKLHVAGAIRSDTLVYVGPGVRTLFATPNGRIYDSLALPSALSWEINGNGNITAAQFLGTTNANDVIFKTNSVERARILANGNMGVGIPNPAVTLEINNRARVSSTNPLIELNGTFAAIPNLASIAIRSAGEVVMRSNSTNAAIPDWELKYGTGTYAYPNDAFYIGRRAVPTATAPNYFIMINNIGNVGVGTTTPGNRLEITSATANASGLRFTNLTSASPTVAANGKALSVDANGDVVLMPSASDAWKLLGNAGTTAGTNFLGTTDAQDLVFKTNNLERGRFLGANGFLGLGTTTPGSRLEVSAIGGDGITIKATTGIDAGDLMFFDAAGVEKGRVYTNPLAASGLILSGGTIPAAHVFINNLGNVGIGNSAPNNRVEITSATANTSGLRFSNLTSASPTVASTGKALSVNATGDVILVPASGGNAWELLGNAGTIAGTNFLGTTDAQDLVFKTNSIERIKTLASNGNVGIAMTTPDARLHIHNDFGVNGTENPILILEQNGINANNGCSIEFKNDGAGYNSAIAGIDDGGNDGRLEFRTNDDGIITTSPLTSAHTRMIILQNGNVGINTLLPSEKFHVNGNAQIGDVLPATGTGNYLTFSNYTNNTDILSIFRTNTLADQSDLNVSIGDNYGQGAGGIDRFNIGAYLSGGGPGLNNIFTVTSQGRAGIGQYNPAALLHVTQPAISGTPIAIYESGGMVFNAFINTTFGGYTNPAGILYWELGGAETYMFGGEVVPDGDGNWNLGAATKRWNTVFATNGAINTSDARLKKDITGLSYGLNDLLKLKPVEYNWKDEALKGHCHGKNLGFLAQDLEKVIPNVVYTPKDEKEYYGVNYEALIPVLTKSIQELNQKLEEKTADLKAVNDSYQAQINELKKMIEELKK